MARKKIQEGHLGDMAMKAEMDHEVQMARSDLYKIAKYAVELHDMLKGVSEAEGIEGWQQAKITKAADYLGSVFHSMDYETNISESNQLDEIDFGGLVGGAVNVAKNPRQAAKSIARATGKKAAELIKGTRNITTSVLKARHGEVDAQIKKLANQVNDSAKGVAVDIAMFKTRASRKEARKAVDRIEKLLSNSDIAKFYTGKQNVQGIVENLKRNLDKLERVPSSKNPSRKIIYELIEDLQATTEVAEGIIAKTLKNKRVSRNVKAALVMGLFILSSFIIATVNELEDDTNEEAIEEKKQKDWNKDGKNDWEDVKAARRAAAAAASQNESVNSAMLRQLNQAVEYKLGKIGVANVSPKAKYIAETTVLSELKKIRAIFKKRVDEGQYGEITHTDEDPTMAEVLVKGMGVYRIDQLEQRIKDRINNVAQLLDRGEADQAAALLDPNSSTYKSLLVMMKALAEAHDELAFGDHSMSAGIN